MNNQSGIIVVDKPAGLSSARAVSILKKSLRAKKVGHSGTLDPFATGVLICCINKATRLAGFFLGGSKKYQGTLNLGTETNTCDPTGDIIRTSDVKDITENMIRDVFKMFKGRISQVPPVYSALKHKGVPLYKLARKGKPVTKPPREVNIYELQITDIQLPDIHFNVFCSAGTYIRTLCSDIGSELGCGGHLKWLRRTESCGFSLKDAVPLENIQEEKYGQDIRIISMASALPRFPEFICSSDIEKKIRHGMPLTLQITESIEISDAKYIKALDQNGALLAILEVSENKKTVNYNCVFTS